MGVLNKNGYAALVEREKANLDYFLNLCVLSLLFVIECVAARMVGWPGSAAIPWTAIVMAYGFYRLAIPCAEKWYDWINAAYDLYRYQLAEQMALRPFENKADETVRWKALSYFIRRYDIKCDDPDIFSSFHYPLPTRKESQVDGKKTPHHTSSEESPKEKEEKCSNGG
jgi:hypothetical protein